jgi:hypothetical protein
MYFSGALRFGWMLLGARGRVLLAAVAGVLVLWAVAVVGSAGGTVSTCGAGGVFSVSSSTASCSYTQSGADTFLVPSGVNSATFTVDGAQGGSPSPCCSSPSHAAAGGKGGVVSATLAVSGGDSFAVNVGALGTNGGGQGGSSANPGGDGGGYSSVSNDRGVVDSTLLVAGGGGGGGGGGLTAPNSAVSGGTGAGSGAVDGDPGADTQTSASDGGDKVGGGGGGQAYANGDGGGAGGQYSGTTCSGGAAGQSGSSGTDGSTPGAGGYTFIYGGGGGGGGGGYVNGVGFVGGGGGGGGDNLACNGGQYGGGGGGGGGGSSYAATDRGSATTNNGANAGSGQVMVSWSVSATSTSVSAPASGTTNTAIAPDSISSTLSGATSDAGGTLTFKVFGPQSSPPTDCSGGTTVGTASVSSGNGNYSPSAGFTPTGAGTYWWYASYGGDSNNGTSNSGCGSGMASTTVVSSTTTSVSAPASGTTNTAIAAGSISSTLSGGTSPTGTITFMVFGPQSSAPTDCTTGGTTVGTASVSSGNGNYSPSAGFTPPTAGTYWWYASYGGDSNNGTSNSGCGSGMTKTVVFRYQPDAQIKLASDTSYLGVGIVNTTGAGQTRSSTTARGKSARFDLRFANAGTHSDAIAVHGCKSTSGFTVQYFKGTTNVSTEVTAGTYKTGTLGAGASRVLKLKIAISFTAEAGKTDTCAVTASSNRDPNSQDVVKAKVKVG